MMFGLGLGGLGLQSAGSAGQGGAYAVAGRQPVLLLDFSAGVYADNSVWWAEAPTQPGDAVVFADFESGRYAA